MQATAGIAIGVASALALASGAACGSSGHSGATTGEDGGATDATTRGDASGGDAMASESGPASDSAVDAGLPHTAKLPVKHVIFFVKENRTFDIYFGKFPGANGATTGTLCNGADDALQPMLDRSDPDINHSWASALTAYNDGGMDCFDLITPGGATAQGMAESPMATSRPTQADIPNYWTLAQQ